jgi:outer membrane biogenesis lipoprotein LolB
MRLPFIIFVFLLVVLLLLTGCSTVVPVSAKFPEAPERLMQKCPQLEKLNDGSKLSDVAKTVADNYSSYHECSVKHDGWIEWYQKQKQIFEGVK